MLMGIGHCLNPSFYDQLHVKSFLRINPFLTCLHYFPARFFCAALPDNVAFYINNSYGCSLQGYQLMRQQFHTIDPKLLVILFVRPLALTTFYPLALMPTQSCMLASLR
jgi:hypothetical protein